jgi:predicted tellurium resistance membrane protein TerC
VTNRTSGKVPFAGGPAPDDLFIVLVMIETTDIAFVPIDTGHLRHHDTFIIYTSNIFAILGLRCSTSWPASWRSSAT